MEVEDPKASQGSRAVQATGVALSGNPQVQFTYLQEVKGRGLGFVLGSWVGGRTHIPEIPVQDFDVAVNDLQRRELVVSRRDSTHEEERSVSPVDNLGI